MINNILAIITLIHHQETEKVTLSHLPPLRNLLTIDYPPAEAKEYKEHHT